MVMAAQTIAQKDLATLSDATEALADGDLTSEIELVSLPVSYTASDEMGELAAAFNIMISKLQETGDSFGSMTQKVRQQVQRIAESAQYLSTASNRLAAIAIQSKMTSSQIATTIQQVATGTTQQAEAVSQTTGCIEHMAETINRVAGGIQTQTSAVEKATRVTNQINTAIPQVSANAQANDAVNAVQVSQSAAKVVETTVKGMESIKARVDMSARKVQEMGERSSQIEMIVDTIEDIASQTNLLALNAAIEAARAGQNGKSFVVVAGEVRKLAVKSANATKEIAELVRGIQQTVKEAILAMSEGAGEVETGVALANESRKALVCLLESFERSKRSGEEISTAAMSMANLATELVRAMDSVSAVVEENSVATEEMTASSGNVIQIIADIASVSEENSAAAEEVSASTEEMSAQVEEVSASAQSLARMASALQDLASQFKLDNEMVTGAKKNTERIRHSETFCFRKEKAAS